jgi:hypothetical protein
VFATDTGGKKTPMPFGVLLCNRRTAFRIQPARVYTTSSKAWCKYFAPSAYACTAVSRKGDRIAEPPDMTLLVGE